MGSQLQKDPKCIARQLVIVRYLVFLVVLSQRLDDGATLLSATVRWALHHWMTLEEGM